LRLSPLEPHFGWTNSQDTADGTDQTVEAGLASNATVPRARVAAAVAGTLAWGRFSVERIDEVQRFLTEARSGRAPQLLESGHSTGSQFMRQKNMISRAVELKKAN